MGLGGWQFVFSISNIQVHLLRVGNGKESQDAIHREDYTKIIRNITVTTDKLIYEIVINSVIVHNYMLHYLILYE